MTDRLDDLELDQFQGDFDSLIRRGAWPNTSAGIRRRFEAIMTELRAAIKRAGASQVESAE